MESPEEIPGTLKPGDPTAADVPPPIEIGLVLTGQLDAVDRQAIEGARSRVGEELQRWFPEFVWRLVVVQREELPAGRREEPVSFFQQGQTERDLHKWDFVLLVTSADLIGHYKPFALAAVSRTLDLAVLSTARLDPRSMNSSADSESRVKCLTHRVTVILLRCLGHLNGLDHDDSPNNLMWDADDVDELDRTQTLAQQQIDDMRKNLLSIADLRLEERDSRKRPSTILFLMRVAWFQRREISAGVLEAAPWQFPVRFSRLTTAAVSALLFLSMTAEVWDMSLNQSPLTVSGLIIAVITLTTAYVVTRQQLLVRRQDRSMTEQIAVSNITSTVTVLCGMITTLLTLFTSSMAIGLLLFPRRLIDGWAASINEPISLAHYLLLSGVVSALGLAIGALGAAFENQQYFRHVIFVDEEL